MSAEEALEKASAPYGLLEPVKQPRASATAAGPKLPPPRNTVPALVLVSAGIVSTYAGALLIVGAESKYATARQLAGETNRTCPAGDPKAVGLCADLGSATAATDLMGNLGIGAFVLGGLLGAGAAATLVFPRESSPAKAKASVRVVPVAGATAGGAVIQGSF